MGKVLGKECLADTVGPDEDDVGGTVEPFEPEEIFDLGTIDLLGPVPVKVCQGFEVAEPSAPHASLETAA